MNNNVFVCCSAKNLEEYKDISKCLGHCIADAGDTLWTGGSADGEESIMGWVADGYNETDHRQPQWMVTTWDFYLKDGLKQNALWGIEQTIMQRQEKLIDKADIVVIFIGGLGTLAELFDSYVTRQVKEKYQEIIVYNYNHHWDALEDLWQDLYDKGVTSRPDKYVHFVHDAYSFAKAYEEARYTVETLRAERGQ